MGVCLSLSMIVWLSLLSVLVWASFLPLTHVIALNGQWHLNADASLGMRERGALEWARDTVENIYKNLVFRINPD